MKQYLFKTSLGMKYYNCKKWWIDNRLVRDEIIEGESVNGALSEYVKMLDEKYSIDVSKTALKNKEKMYRDFKNGESRQVGYVLTGSTEFDCDRIKWVKQYIEIWVEIFEINRAVFE